MFIICWFLLFLIAAGWYSIENGYYSSLILCIIFGIPIALFMYMVISEKDIKMIKEDIKNYKDKLKWTRALKNSSIVNEFIEYINSNYVHNVWIYENKINMDEKEIVYSTKQLNNLSVEGGCKALAEELKKQLRFGKLYTISPISKIVSSGFLGNDRIIGFREGPNGYISAEYSGEDRTYRTIGYKLEIKINYDMQHETDNIKSWIK